MNTYTLVFNHKVNETAGFVVEAETISGAILLATQEQDKGHRITAIKTDYDLIPL
jgi:hypothetical protein